MDKRDLAVLERIFEHDVGQALGGCSSLPMQFSRRMDARLERLAAEGYIEPDIAQLGGRFPVAVKGWKLTMRGHATYCFSCDGEPD